jgi:hypothetical protein
MPVIAGKITGQEFKQGNAFDVNGCQCFSAKVSKMNYVAGVEFATAQISKMTFNILEYTTGTLLIGGQDIMVPSGVLTASIMVSTDFSELTGWLEVWKNDVKIYGPIFNNETINIPFLQVVAGDTFNLMFGCNDDGAYYLSDSMGDNTTRFQILYLS